MRQATLLFALVVGACASMAPTHPGAHEASGKTTLHLDERTPLREAVDAYVARTGQETQNVPSRESRLSAAAGASDTGDLAKATQNPVSDLISLPFQNNFNFGVGPGDDVQYVLNVQPVVPFKLNQDWNLITRTILPVIYQPVLVPGGSSDFGLGDTTFTAFLSPARPGKAIWGAGPVLLLPTSTGNTLGAGQWGLGPSAVVLTMDGPWVYGALVSNVTSFEGDVNQFLLQPFANYNLPDGWYLVSAPVVTANWEASGRDRWTVPLGGGVGRVFKIGKQPVNAQAQVFYNVEHPGVGPEWSLRLQIQLLFPK